MVYKWSLKINSSMQKMKGTTLSQLQYIELPVRWPTHQPEGRRYFNLAFCTYWLTSLHSYMIYIWIQRNRYSVFSVEPLKHNKKENLEWQTDLKLNLFATFLHCHQYDDVHEKETRWKGMFSHSVNVLSLLFHRVEWHHLYFTPCHLKLYQCHVHNMPLH